MVSPWTISHAVKAVIGLILAVHCVWSLATNNPSKTAATILLSATLSLTILVIRYVWMACTIIPWQAYCFLGTVSAGIMAFMVVGAIIKFMAAEKYLRETMMLPPRCGNLDPRYIKGLFALFYSTDLFTFLAVIITNQATWRVVMAVGMLLASIFFSFTTAQILLGLTGVLKKRIKDIHQSAKDIFNRIQQRETMELIEMKRKRTERRSAENEANRDFSSAGRIGRLDKVISVQMLLAIHKQLVDALHANNQPESNLKIVTVQSEGRKESKKDPDPTEGKLPIEATDEGKGNKTMCETEIPDSTSAETEHNIKKMQDTFANKNSNRDSNKASSESSFSRSWQQNTTPRANAGEGRRSSPSNSSKRVLLGQPKNPELTNLAKAHSVEEEKLNLSLLNFDRLRIHLLRMLVWCLCVGIICTTSSVLGFIIVLNNPGHTYSEWMYKQYYSDYTVGAELNISAVLVIDILLIALAQRVEVHNKHQIARDQVPGFLDSSVGRALPVSAVPLQHI
mmetsp:Transcript_5281/g.10482  ORF Transcript_5281/g.10482 Transcript_5281/m.10482 type:complete len:509 (-) Transcript_5281:243-1769(-)